MTDAKTPSASALAYQRLKTIYGLRSDLLRDVETFGEGNPAAHDEFVYAIRQLAEAQDALKNVLTVRDLQSWEAWVSVAKDADDTMRRLGA